MHGFCRSSVGIRGQAGGLNPLSNLPQGDIGRVGSPSGLSTCREGPLALGVSRAPGEVRGGWTNARLACLSDTSRVKGQPSTGMRLPLHFFAVIALPTEN